MSNIEWHYVLSVFNYVQVTSLCLHETLCNHNDGPVILLFGPAYKVVSLLLHRVQYAQTAGQEKGFLLVWPYCQYVVQQECTEPASQLPNSSLTCKCWCYAFSSSPWHPAMAGQLGKLLVSPAYRWPWLDWNDNTLLYSHSPPTCMVAYMGNSLAVEPFNELFYRWWGWKVCWCKEVLGYCT